MSQEIELPLVFIEIGLNHNGSLENVRKIMIKTIAAAVGCGFPREKLFFKFQKRDPETSTPEHMRDKPRVSPVSGNLMTYLEYRKEIEFGKKEYERIDQFARDYGVSWFVSIWDLPSLNFMADFRVPFLKIPSALIGDITLISATGEVCLDSGTRMVVSTGMSTPRHIENAVVNTPLLATDPILMVCTSTYPCPDEEANISRIDAMRHRYGDPIGYSSHSVSPHVPIAAFTVFDAKAIEVHVTLDRAMPGSDHSASLEIPGVELLLRELVRFTKIHGDGVIGPLPSEEEKMRSLRK